MKIKIIGMSDPLILKELAIINQGFFSTWEFVEDEADLSFEFPPLKSPNKTTKDRKYTYLKTYLQFLTQKTGKQQPWGLLNSMRPNKLVHSMKKRGATEVEITNQLQNTYLIQAAKTNLLQSIASHQLKIIPNLYNLEQEVSIYIGIPFCPTRCAYCTFAAYPYEPNKKWVAPFLNALYNEIWMIGQYLIRQRHKIKISTIYIGGGTPTILSAKELRSLLNALFDPKRFPQNFHEITVEAGRPDTLTPEKLQVLKDFYIDRISINPQSFN